MSYLFWLSLIVLIYTYIGYPAIMCLLAKYFANPVMKDPLFQPTISIIMSAYNEGGYIEKKVSGLLDVNYPEEKIEILVGSDGSSDDTVAQLSCISDPRLKTFIFEKRRGKPNVLNDLASHAKGDMLVLCDVRQEIEKDAMARLVSNFADNRVGCVSGELIFDKAGDDNGIAEGVGFYWKYEKSIRKAESAVHSMVGATGALYAIRKELYALIPHDMILDDVYVPLAIARKGYRCIFDETARVHDRAAVTVNEEYRRKVRTLAGNYQIFGVFRDILVPFSKPVSISLFSHKLLRVLAPFFLIILFPSNLVLVAEGLYFVLIICQVLFYLLAMMGYCRSSSRRNCVLSKMSYAAYAFCYMNFAALAGFYRFVFNKQQIAWER